MSGGTDLVVWFLSGAEDEKWKPSFKRPVAALSMPSVSPGSIRKYDDLMRKQYPGNDAKGRPRPLHTVIERFQKTTGKRVLRVCVVGFSAGCYGVRSLLRGPDAGIIDTAVLCDGLHSKNPTEVIAFANLAAYGTPESSVAKGQSVQCLISNSSIEPGYTPTHVASEKVLEAVGAGAKPGRSQPEPVDPNLLFHDDWKTSRDLRVVYKGNQPPIKYAVRVGNLYVLSYYSNGAADHVYQAQVVLPLMLRNFVAPRWNELDPEEGTTARV